VKNTRAVNPTVLYLSIIGLSVGAYFVMLDNFFISDDFTLMRFMQALDLNPLYIWQAPSSSEFFRIASYVYFWLCFHIFGLNAKPFYWTGIGLHTIISVLVFLWVFRVCRNRLAAWVSALFFSAYAIHQEAVMWISAANELILVLNCLVFLLLWEQYLDSTDKHIRYALALAAFSIALFSKEAAVVLAPLAFLRLLGRGHSASESFWKSVPLLVMVAAYVTLWLSQAHRNFFVTDRHYVIGSQFFTVYSRSLANLIAALIPFAAVFAFTRSLPDKWYSKRPLLFFSVFVPLSILPFSFLTYSNYIPSRNMYFPSIGVSALIGILFATLYTQSGSAAARRACMFLLIGSLGWNVYNIWLKHAPEYARRAAPTTQLIEVLRGLETGAQAPGLPALRVCQFPLHPSIGVEVVRFFTNLMPDNVVFSNNDCDATKGIVLRWDKKSERYTTQLLSFNQSQPDVSAGTR
jgi:hypothetical protein